MDRIENNRQYLFTTRKAEHTDTHDHIKHHDPDYYKNKKQNKRDDFEDHDEDEAFISIQSILIFLEGLTKNTEPRHFENTSKPIDNSMKKAMSAYGGSQNEIKKQYTYLDDEAQDIDQTVVLGLIDALTTFKNQGFDNIRLIPANGFLQSVQTTVEKIQSFD